MLDTFEPQSSNLVVSDDKGNEFVATRLSVSSGLSVVNRYEVEVFSQNIASEDWLGSTLTCSVYEAPGASRSALREYKGVVTSVRMLTSNALSRYEQFQLTIQPWVALLAYSRGSRVFQEKTTKDIVTSIFDELGFRGKYSIDSMPTTKREYCVQFNETDLAFVQRLLAEEGVHFFVDKNAQSDTLILHDASKPFDSSKKTSLDHISAPGGENDVISHWAPGHQFHAASLELSGYDYSQSKRVTSNTKKSTYSIAENTKLTDVRYPAPSVTGDLSDYATLATVQCAQLNNQYQHVSGETQSYELAEGHYFSLASHQLSGQTGDYLVTHLNYEFDALNSTVLNIRCRFQSAPKAHHFYPERIEKPQMIGLQSAVVSGQSDEEPSCDALGRIRIKFHWDTETSGDKSSCYVRVAQSLAGNGYGVQFLPRAAQEVLVSFINGDPDQPIVTGTVYNSRHKVPYAAQNTTQSGIKTKLAGNTNELRFDDKKDKEQLYLHAAKDYALEVENDIDETVTGERRMVVKKDVKETTEKGYSLSAKEDITQTTEAGFSIIATDAINGKGKTITLTAEDKLKLVVGDSSISISSSKIELSSGTVSISGDSSIKLDAGSISQSGDSVAIKSSAAINVKAGTALALKATTDFKAQGLNAEMKGTVSATVKGSASAELSASGSATVKGGVVMVN